jgi:L-ascorbate metabolism protein UlaG (beta-lactamase superfamily)
MKSFFKITLKIMLTIFSLIVIAVLSIFIFMKTAPQFGAKLNKETDLLYSASKNFKDGTFQNQSITTLDLSAKDMSSMLYQFLFKNEGRVPKSPIPVKYDSINQIDSTTHVTWYGHSAILLEIDGNKILIDPMFGNASAPVSFTSKRFKYQQPIPIESFKDIDAVILSHDHYDHLDYNSIIKLKPHVNHFYTALGVGQHLIAWGIEKEKITELDWWESTYLKEIKLTATPARHFSGRGISDRNKTQWASWVIAGEKENIYFSGDSGYDSHFKMIGDQLGPFDFAMIECGQYNELWSNIHMMPEESIQASSDLNAKLVMPIHWGAFKLAMHNWTDPIERASKAATIKGIEVTTPMVGERFTLTTAPKNKWWEGIK